MFYFIKGTVEFVFDNFIVVENNGIGYQIYVSKSEQYKVNRDIFLYIYTVIKEDEQYYIGFNNIEEKNVFLLLIKVKGLGPKTAVNLLKNSNAQSIYDAIASNNIKYLKSLPGIGNRMANQIVLDLHDYLSKGKEKSEAYDDAYQALKTLGFKKVDIDEVLSSINIFNITSEELVKIALSKLKK